MSSSSAISLFSAQPDLEKRPYSFLVSMVVHTAVIVLVFLGLFAAPKVRTSALTERYAVRHLELHMLDPEIERAAASAIEAPPSPQPKAPKLPPGGAAEEQQVLRQVLDAPRLRHTLVQPDIPKPLKLPKELPLPTVVVWNEAKVPVKTIVAPAPQSPPVSLAKPVIQRPNHAPTLADISIPATDSLRAQPIMASTTSPVIISGPKPTPPAPLTNAAGSGQPAAGTVMSLTDTRMANGSVVLPPGNQSASANSPGALAPGTGKQPSQAGHATTPGAAGGGGARPGPGSGGSTQNAGAEGRGIGGRPLTTHIARQKEGQFGAVVVGSAIQDRYPEIADLWSGRLAYTVYLPVGLAKSWILQYSISKPVNAAPGTVHVDAPWPYSIVRPNIEPGSIDADALMIHGFVNEAGRFEALTVAFPAGFAQAKFVVNALAQWQFRPATQNGQDVKVEVVLIIPEEQEQ